MSLQSLLFRLGAGRSDKKRDASIPLPHGIVSHVDISYGAELLDIYYPEGTASSLPTILSIHGGGYVYGSKEIYRRYCMDLARRGFAVVNFNYRLAPKWKFPTPLEDTNAVMEWICKHASGYHLDPGNLFLVGDSAGAQLASQYAAIWANPAYAGLFSFCLPDITIKAVGLNCGMYDVANMTGLPRKGLAKDYLSRNTPPNDPRFAVLSAIGKGYPPAHITTACHDFLRDAAQPMYAHLTAKGIPCRIDCYGSEEDTSTGHVFHVNILKPEAVRCNDDQCAFFREYL